MNIFVGVRISVVPGKVKYFSCVTANISYGKRVNHPMITEKRHYAGASKPLDCKVAIVTGGAKGIGLAIADSMLAAGARTVVLGDVLKDECEKATCKLNEKYGVNKALFQMCDVKKKEDFEKLFKSVKDKIGQLDVLVNNAGILADNKWEDAIAINAAGLVRGTLLGFQYMGANNGGKGGYIINLASILGLQPLSSSPMYVGTKHFVIGFTRSMGADYFCKLTNVKVMAVCPGVTDTTLISDASKGALTGFGDLAKELTGSLGKLPSQKTSKVGEAVIEMIKSDQNGSVWVSEGNENYKAHLPDRSTFKCAAKDPCPPPCPPPCPKPCPPPCPPPCPKPCPPSCPPPCPKPCAPACPPPCPCPKPCPCPSPCPCPKPDPCNPCPKKETFVSKCKITPDPCQNNPCKKDPCKK